MLLVAVQSSDIAAMGYDPASTELQVQFRTGAVYSYQNVPPELYNGLINASSKGSFFVQNIRKFPALYPYSRLGDIAAQPNPSQSTGVPSSVSNPVESALQNIQRFENL